MYYLLFRRIDGFNGSGDPIKGEAIGIGKYDSLKDNTTFEDWLELSSKLDGEFMRHWVWERITKSEYETFRDLHEFKIFETCPSGTKE